MNIRILETRLENLIFTVTLKCDICFDNIIPELERDDIAMSKSARIVFNKPHYTGVRLDAIQQLLAINYFL